MPDNKFYYLSENMRCPYCGSDKVKGIGNSKYSGYIVKCDNCGKIMTESDLEEKKEKDENEALGSA